MLHYVNLYYKLRSVFDVCIQQCLYNKKKNNLQCDLDRCIRIYSIIIILINFFFCVQFYSYLYITLNTYIYLFHSGFNYIIVIYNFILEYELNYYDLMYQTLKTGNLYVRRFLYWKLQIAKIILFCNILLPVI